jgi:hypothetical protein
MVLCGKALKEDCSGISDFRFLYELLPPSPPHNSMAASFQIYSELQIDQRRRWQRRSKMISAVVDTGLIYCMMPFDQ